MYDRLKSLYDSGKINSASLQKAVLMGWITAEEKKTIEGVV